MRVTHIVGAVVLAATHMASGQNLPVQLRVRVLDCRSGHVVKERSLGLYTNFDDMATNFDSRKVRRVPPLIRAKTGRDGVAIFTLPSPRTAKVFIGDRQGFEDVDVETALRTGVMTKLPKLIFCTPPTRYRPTLHPGEVVYWVFHLTLLEKLWVYTTP